MGQSHGGRHHGSRPARSTSAPTAPDPAVQQTESAATQSTPAGTAAHRAPRSEVMTPKDVVITSGPSEAKLANYLKDKIIAEQKCSVYCNTELESTATKRVAKALVDCKLFVFVVGVESGASTLSADAVALAYISNKPILICAQDSRANILGSMVFGMKLTVQKMQWYVFSPDDYEAQFPKLLTALQAALSGDTASTPDAEVETQTIRKKLYAHPRQQVSKVELVGDKGNFWQRNFGDDTSEVPWYKFQQCFLQEFEKNIKEIFDDDKMPWLLNILKDEVFTASSNEMVTKERFTEVRGDSDEQGHIWKVVSEIATEKYTMNEVFNMESTVRLTAVENLGKFQTPAVVDALMKLLDDEDPNIRAIAAISLGRTGTQDKVVINRLLFLLDDRDRICRQSACLSLGHIKALEAVPKISHLWRNDFISTVREAAKTALEQIGGPDAERILRVTNILQDEIAELEGKK